MLKQLAPSFSIEAATEADVSGIGQAHVQSMLENYPNTKADISEAWIKQRMNFLVKPDGDEYRRKTVERAERDPNHELYLVVKDIGGQVIGFFHATRTEEQSKLEAIYLTREAQGEGVGDKLMERGLEFAGNLPMTLEVVNYNQRAISFYEKHGFRKVPNSETILRDKLPVFVMERPVKGETANEI